jgi:predicted nucleic acid-binding protein
MSDEIYPGTIIFIDANIFLYGILGHFKFGNACKVFLEQVNKGEYKAVTSFMVCNEVVHRTMIAEVVEKYGIEPRLAVSYLKNNWKIVKELNKAQIAIDIIKQIDNLRIVELNKAIFDQAFDYSKKYGLLSNDAIHAATMNINQIKNMATNDRDFERIEWIKIWKP